MPLATVSSTAIVIVTPLTQKIQSPTTVHEREQRQRERDRLREGLELAHPGRGEDVVTRDDEAVDRDPDFADQHDDRDPPRQLAEDRQPDEGEPGEHLVGDRVQELAEVGDDVVLRAI